MPTKLEDEKDSPTNELGNDPEIRAALERLRKLRQEGPAKWRKLPKISPAPVHAYTHAMGDITGVPPHDNERFGYDE